MRSGCITAGSVEPGGALEEWDTMWQRYLGLAAVLACTPSAVFAQNVPAVFAQTTSAVSTQTGPSVSRYYIFDVGPIVGNLTSTRVNQGGQMIWNSGGHAYLYQNCESRADCVESHIEQIPVRRRTR
jgi:hypothetical protein